MTGSHVQVGVTVGARTKVWQFASLIRKAVIGEDCVIAAFAMVDGATLGNRVLVGTGAFICPGTEIGHGVFFGPGARTCNDRWPSVSKEGFDVDVLVSGHVITVRIGSGASIGAGATILPGVQIGAGARVAAGAVVRTSVPDGHLYKCSGEIVPIDPHRKNERMRPV